MDHNYETWFNRKWRPSMGWSYIVTCICDFVIFPVLWSLLQAVSQGSVTSQWNPITLQGAGLYHVAMGGILGVTAWWRSKEKMAGVVSNPVLENNIKETAKIQPKVEPILPEIEPKTVKKPPQPLHPLL
jgi:hypothetical protein